MAGLDDDLEASDFARILAYGPPGTRKTWWAGRAAELGFNVILADLDNGFKILKQLSPEARKRVFRIDMRAPADGYANCGAMALAHALNGNVCYFDEETRQYTPKAKIQPDKTYVKLDFKSMTGRDVLAIDSWTIFVQQLGLVNQSVLDPLKIAKFEWDDYAKIRLVLDHSLSNCKRLNGHLIVIGHSETNAKRKKNAGEKEKPETAIEQIRLQPYSATRAHGEIMANAFSDVLYFEIPNPMQGTFIDTRGSVDFDAKSRSVGPKIYKFDDLNFAEFVSPDDVRSVANNAEYSSAAATNITGAEIEAAKAEAGSASINVGSSAIGLKIGGLKA